MILSLHIPKTAGVSIRNVLKEHYGPGFVLWYWQITDAWGQVCADVPGGATCVHGHFRAEQLSARFPAARLMTWVRDPVERVVSSYYHRRRDPDWQHPVCQELHRRNLTLLQYAALPAVRNEMCNFVGGKQAEEFFFIGVVEEFELSFARMCGLLGMPPVAARHDNANPARQEPRYDLEPGVRQELAELNSDDVALYARFLRQAGFPVPCAPPRRAVAAEHATATSQGPFGEGVRLAV